METKLDVIGIYIGNSLLAMLFGFFLFIPFAAIYMFGFSMLFLLGLHESGRFGDGTTFALTLLYAFSIGLGETWSQRQEDKRRTAEIDRLQDRIQDLL